MPVFTPKGLHSQPRVRCATLGWGVQPLGGKNPGETILPAVLLAHLVQDALAVGNDVPGVGPEAQIQTPPVVRDSRLVQRRQQLVEVDDAGAERIVSAGVVIVERPIRVDEMNVRYLALQFLRQLQGSARQGLLVANLVGARRRHTCERDRCRKARRNSGCSSRREPRRPGGRSPMAC